MLMHGILDFHAQVSMFQLHKKHNAQSISREIKDLFLKEIDGEKI